MMHGGLLGVWATQIPLVKERLRLDTAVLGFALICSALGGIAAMQGASLLMRRFGGLGLLRVTMLLACLTLPAVVVSGSVWMLGAGLLVFGAGYGLVDLVMNAQAVQVELLRGRPIMSRLHGMWSLGALCGAALGSLLLALVPPIWQMALLSATALGCVLAVSGSMLPMSETAPAPMGDTTRTQRTPRIRGLMWRKPLLLTGAMMAIAFSVEGALLDWGAIFLRETRHLPGSEAGLGYAAFAGSMLLGRLSGDRARARWGDRRVLQGATLAGVFLAFAVLVPDPWVAIAGFALTGTMLCNVAPILFNLAGRFGDAAGPGGATQAVASVVSLGYAGVMAAPPLFGVVARQSSLPAALCIAAGLCLVMGLTVGSKHLRF